MENVKEEYVVGKVRKVIAFDICFLTLTALQNLMQIDYKTILLLATSDFKKFNNLVSWHADVDDYFIYFNMQNCSLLYIINKLTLYGQEKRVIILLDKASFPVVQLMRCLGVGVIICRRDEIFFIMNTFRQPILKNHLSPLIKSLFDSKTQENSSKVNECAPDDIELLTPMERIVVIELLNGKSPLSIARKYCISIKTVSCHKVKSISKMKIKSLSDFFVKKHDNNPGALSFRKYSVSLN